MKKVDFVSLVFISLGVMLFLSGVFIVYRAFSSQEIFHDADYYYNEDLNFSFYVPHGWELAAPEGDEVKSVVKEVTGGVLFDMMYHRLTKEIVPLAMVQKPTDGKIQYAKFMTFAFRGADDEYSYLNDKEKLKGDFKKLLEETEHKSVNILSAEDYKKEMMNGVLLKATATFEGENVNYIQYLEPAGKNILIVTFGAIKSHEESLKELEEILSTLKYHEGGVTAPPSIQKDMVEDSLIEEEILHNDELPDKEFKLNFKDNENRWKEVPIENGDKTKSKSTESK